MSKVEDLARKYCEGSSFEDACIEKPAYIAGYHQAAKDLELTCEDIVEIETLLNLVRSSAQYKNGYKEVLKRFKNFKDRKEK